MQIDWLAAADVEELQEFIDEHWRRGHLLAHDAGLLRWQHRFPDDPGRLSVLVARQGGRIVGTLGAIPVSFCVRGRRLPGAWLTTWSATPAARRQQAGLRLLRHALAEPFDFVGTTGANETALRIYGALGFSIRESIPRWVRVLSDDALGRLLGGRTPPYGAPPARPPVADSLRVSPWTEGSAQRWQELWESQLAPQLTGTWRDAAYLRWRFLEHPHFPYAVRFVEDVGGSLRGLAVHRIADIRGGEGRVVRIVELLGDREVATALLSDVIATGSRAGAAFVEFYCVGAATVEPLEACGFTLEPEPTGALPAMFEPLNFEIPPTLTCALHLGEDLGEESAALASDALYLTRADGDQDRPNEPIGPAE
jgi:Acetyltransferase (GNAT) domain